MVPGLLVGGGVVLLLAALAWRLFTPRTLANIAELCKTIADADAPVVNVVYNAKPRLLVSSADNFVCGDPLLTVPPAARLLCRISLFRYYAVNWSFGDIGPVGSDVESLEVNGMLALERALWAIVPELPEHTTFLVNGETPDWTVINGRARILGVVDDKHRGPDWRAPRTPRKPPGPQPADGS